MRLPFFTALGFVLGLAGPGLPGTWDETVAAAKGQTVYWNAWGGDERTNDFIAWVGSEVRKRYGVTINHVKLSDTAEAVARV
ncbi:MAG: ABC transporter substrate-binding protein, partial [Albidovulum sp.]